MADKRTYARWALIGGVLLVLTAAPVTAAPPAKAPVTYTASGGASTINGNYSTIASMTLPAGKYLIGGSGTVNNQTGNPDQVSCNLYAGTDVVNASTVDVPLQYGSLAFAGVATLTASSLVRIECIAGQPSGPNVGARITATTVTDIVVQ